MEEEKEINRNWGIIQTKLEKLEDYKGVVTNILEIRSTSSNRSNSQSTQIDEIYNLMEKQREEIQNIF